MTSGEICPAEITLAGPVRVALAVKHYHYIDPGTHKILIDQMGWLLLTHLHVEKMVDILADNIFKCIFLNENDGIPIQFSLKFVPRSPIDNKPALVQVMAWRRSGAEPLPEPMLTQFTDAYMQP